MAETEVLTTIHLANHTDWSATDITDKLESQTRLILVQSDDGNAGIVGTPRQLADMLTRIEAALENLTLNGATVSTKMPRERKAT